IDNPVSTAAEAARAPAAALNYTMTTPKVNDGSDGWERQRRDQIAAAVRRVEAGFAAGFAVACIGAASQPPAGLAALTASSGWPSGVKVWIASSAAASDCGSTRLATSSRFWPASASPWAGAR